MNTNQTHFLLGIQLLHFRNHTSFVQKLSPLTIILGDNAAGKTNILEAVFLVATGTSFRDCKIEEMVALGQEFGYVMGKVSGSNLDQDSTELQVMVNRGIVQGRRVSKRRLLVNGVARSRAKYVGNLLAVAFRPEDLRLVEGSPGRRRAFWDEVLAQVDPDYARSQSIYAKALRQRNKLLVMIREGETSKAALAYWDMAVVKHGTYLQTKRQQVVDYFNTLTSEGEFKAWSGKAGDDFIGQLNMEYDHSLISEARLDQYSAQELAAGHTLVGPHRDDFIIKLSVSNLKQPAKLDLSKYGSRGQQRMGVLWLKLCSLSYLESTSGKKPILLLDDIMSELDSNHRQMVVDLCYRQQTIVTSADQENIDGLVGEIIKL